MTIFQRVFFESASADRLGIAVVLILLLAIFWGVIARVRRKRAVAKRRRNLFYAMAEGVQLKVTAQPTVDEKPGNSGRWCHDVQQWINHTGTMLGSIQLRQRFPSGIAPTYRKHIQPAWLELVFITNHCYCA
jgi:hypothetical protein